MGCDGGQIDSDRGNDSVRTRAQNSCVAEEERRTALRASRDQQPRNLENTESAEAGKTSDQDQGECRDGESSKQTCQLDLDCKTRTQKQFSQTSSKTSIQSRQTKKMTPNPRDKPENGLHGWNTDLNKLERVLSKLKNGIFSPDQITADVFKAMPPECLEMLARSLSVMCWEMSFPEDWLCSLTVMAPRVLGATCLTKFRPIAGLCAMRKKPGLRVAHVTPSVAIRDCADGVCAEDACGCWPVLVVASCRVAKRMTENLWWYTWT